MTTEKWRLLNAKEIIQAGDKYLDDSEYDTWDDLHSSFIGQPYDVDLIGAPVRRPMTPAEAHAEELLSWMKYLVEWMNDPSADPNAWALMVHGAETAIAKAEGRQP